MRIITFYILILTPMLCLVLFSKVGLLTPMAFTCLLLVYAIIYHPTILGLRLVSKGTIRKSEFAKTYIPFWNWQHYGAAFLN